MGILSINSTDLQLETVKIMSGNVAVDNIAEGLVAPLGQRHRQEDWRLPGPGNCGYSFVKKMNSSTMLICLSA